MIVGKITKQISNPFWSKKFVGILKFKQIQKNSNNKNKNKYKDKDKE